MKLPKEKQAAISEYLALQNIKNIKEKKNGIYKIR